MSKAWDPPEEGGYREPSAVLTLSYGRYIDFSSFHVKKKVTVLNLYMHAYMCAHKHTHTFGVKKNWVKFTGPRYLFLQLLNVLQKDDLLQWDREGCKLKMDIVISGKSAKALDL